MPKVWLEYASDLFLFPRGEQNIPTLGIKHSQAGNKTALRLVVSLLLLMVMGITGAWGQTWPDGLYYIKIGDVYVWRAIAEKTSGQPYLSGLKQTSEYTDPDTGTKYGTANCTWFIKSVNDGSNTYYMFINVATNQYVVWDHYNSGSGKAVHLETRASEPTSSSDNCFFKIEKSSNKYYIHPDECTTSNRGFNYKGNFYETDHLRNRDGDGRGLIQFFDGTDNTIVNAALLPAPTITYDEDYHYFSFTYDQIPSGFDILYTTNGNDPTIGGTGVETYTSGNIYASSSCTVKAVVARYGVVLTEVASQAVEPGGTPPDPVITVTDECTNTITITPIGPTFYYTIDGTTPDNTSGTLYTGPFQQNTNCTIKAIAYFGENASVNVATYSHTAKTAMPTITVDGNLVTITGSGTIYYTTDGSDPTTSSTTYSEPFTLESGSGNITIKAAAKDGALALSCTAEATAKLAYFINNVTALNSITADADCIVTTDFDASGCTLNIDNFSGTFDGGLHTISGLTRPLFKSVNGGTVKNVMLKGVNITSGTNVGAIAASVTGDARIYNCGVLPTATERDADGNITGFTGSSVSGSGYVGSLVGLLDGTARVINCFSYATIDGGTTVGGIVGYNNTSGATQANYATKTIVMNCMFYGEITGGTTRYPVYGGNVIDNAGTSSINNYNYYRGEAAFDDGYTGIANYNRSWPAEEQNLTRFEYYRSILNSNRRLCTWWVNGTANTSPTDSEVSEVGIAKWVLDPGIAPYPVLKPWGKYPSIINPDPSRVWNTTTNQWVQRTAAAPYQGKRLGTLSVTVSTGSHPGTLTGLSTSSRTLTLVITDMDTLNHDYGYAKVQLPYYNEVFGNAGSSNHLTRYYGNYTDKVVTGWKVTAVTDGTQGTYSSDWQTGCNFADRHCTDKDKYSVSGRVFAQGGYYYVPEGVTAITIEAYWGTAFYLHGKDHAVDRVNVTSSKNYGNAFTPAGTLPTTWDYNKMTIYDDLATVRDALTSVTTVYDQAIVLVGNFQVQAQSDISLDKTDGKKVTFMSADLDMDNEPDFCWQLQWRSGTGRPGILPVRFDFLPVPELGLAIRHNTYAYAIGIFVPRGHFEITETSFMHTTQFEYMSSLINTNHQQPLILNGGEFEQIVVHDGSGQQVANTRNIILGGHVWMKRFTPGSHSGQHAITRHCAISVMGGDFPEFYLTGLYWTGVTTSNAYNDSPHCYTNGGRFGIMAGAGMEAVKNNVYFEIDHSVIDEFYGGGINANNPVAGDIHVTINNSLVLDKYCGGPQVGTSGTVTTTATGTWFNQYFGGGNGGTNLYREQKVDGTNDSGIPSSWTGWTDFKPISGQGDDATYDVSKGYHAEYEFEVFNQSNGINAQAVVRTYYLWAQFGTTNTGNVTNTLTGCTVNGNYYGGGNLGNVTGTVTSTLDGCTILGSAFGAGYSATIPSFPVHDKSTVVYPYRDAAGVCHNGTVDYRKDGDAVRQYTWCYKNPTTNVVSPTGVVIPSGVTTSKPAFQYDGKWYCYTTVSLEGLGDVSSDVTLTLTGSTTVGTLEGEEGSQTLREGTGSVYGGGDESAVSGSTTVTIKGTSQILGDVFGGGNNGNVGGSTTVNIQE